MDVLMTMRRIKATFLPTLVRARELIILWRRCNGMIVWHGAMLGRPRRD